MERNTLEAIVDVVAATALLSLTEFLLLALGLLVTNIFSNADSSIEHDL